MILALSILAAWLDAGPAKGSATGASAAVRQADLARCAAMAARDLDRFSSLLSEDVAFYPDEMPVASGRAAVRELLAPFFGPNGPAMRCEPKTAHVSRSGDLAYVTGTYDVTGPEAERSPTRGHGKYVTLWRRQRGGAWKLVLAIGNGEPVREPDFGPPPPP